VKGCGRSGLTERRVRTRGGGCHERRTRLGSPADPTGLSSSTVALFAAAAAFSLIWPDQPGQEHEPFSRRPRIQTNGHRVSSLALPFPRLRARWPRAASKHMERWRPDRPGPALAVSSTRYRPSCVAIPRMLSLPPEAEPGPDIRALANLALCPTLAGGCSPSARTPLIPAPSLPCPHQRGSHAPLAHARCSSSLTERLALGRRPAREGAARCLCLGPQPLFASLPLLLCPPLAPFPPSLRSTMQQDPMACALSTRPTVQTRARGGWPGNVKEEGLLGRRGQAGSARSRAVGKGQPGAGVALPAATLARSPSRNGRPAARRRSTLRPPPPRPSSTSLLAHVSLSSGHATAHAARPRAQSPQRCRRRQPLAIAPVVGSGERGRSHLSHPARPPAGARLTLPSST